jgi:hypothetical protein
MEVAPPDTHSVLLPQGPSRWFAAGFARGRNVTMLSVSSPHLCLDGLPGQRLVFMRRQTKLRVPARGIRTRSDQSKGTQSAQILGNAYRLVTRVIAAPACCASFSGKAFKDCGSCRLDEATRRSSVGAPFLRGGRKLANDLGRGLRNASGSGMPRCGRRRRYRTNGVHRLPDNGTQGLARAFKIVAQGGFAIAIPLTSGTFPSGR